MYNCIIIKYGYVPLVHIKVNNVKFHYGVCFSLLLSTKTLESKINWAAIK